MKQFYVFMLALVLSVCLGTSVSAQNYTAMDYTVRTHGDAYVPLDDPTTLYTGTTYYEMYYAVPMTNPFAIRFFDQLIPAASQRFYASPVGCISADASLSSITQTGHYWSYYPYWAYTGTQTCPYFYTGANYYDNGLGATRFQSGSYLYNANYVLYPFQRYYSWTNGLNGGLPGSAVQMQTIGSAPNRRWVIQFINQRGSGYFYNNGNYEAFILGDFQVVFYEGNTTYPTKIRFNYRYNPEGGVTDQNWDRYADYVGYGSYGSGEVGIKKTGGTNGYISLNFGTFPAPGTILTNYGTSTTTSQLTTQSGVFKNIECDIPDQMGYEFAWFWNYDLALDQTYSTPFPANASIKSKDQAFTPSIKIYNLGKLATTQCSLKLEIRRLGSAAILYTETLNITGNPPVGPIPTGLAGVGPAINFTPFTPTVFDEYVMTWSILSPTTPADQDVTNNTIVTRFIVAPPNDIRAKAILYPPTVPSRTPLAVPTGVSARFDNIGGNDQTNVAVTAVIKNPQGVVVYRDTQILNNWLSGQTRDTVFRDYTPTQKGLYSVCAIALLGSDQLHINDTFCTSFDVRYVYDIKSVAVTDPEDDGEKPEGKRFQVRGLFENVGVSDAFDIRARVRILRCSDNQLVFQADSLPGIPELNIDEGPKVFGFPTRQGTFDTKNLAPGCYKVCVISLLADDVDRSNDTACTFFSVIPKLTGNINVGVGQRFRTISAAVDSMRYRGTKGTLNLILTDNNYTENGMTSVSTPWAAVDMSGIEGPGDVVNNVRATVTWKPKPNVFPTITFTGNKQYCFNYGASNPIDQAPDWMTWDGNSQVVPSPDQTLPEPSKRGLTIVNQSTTPGAIFGMDFGRKNLTFKNLKLRGNGFLSNGNSRIFDMQNNGYSNVNIFGINGPFFRDSAPNQYITIDNNEMGNAAYGIYDAGSVPRFIIGPATFDNYRNHHNVFSRNTIGSQSYPIGTAGISFTNEDGLRIERNHISWVVGPSTIASGMGANSVAGIGMPDGNSVNTQVNGNHIHNIMGGASGYTLGIGMLQASTIYTQGPAGPNQKRSVLPVVTANQVANNFVYDLRAPQGVLNIPILMATATSTYTTEQDKIYNNSISVSDAFAGIDVLRSAEPYLYNNIIQITNTHSVPNDAGYAYYLSVPRPWALNIESDYNLFDLQNPVAGENFAQIFEYDRATGTTIQVKNIATLNDWRTLTGQDAHSVTGNPQFTSDLHLPAATSYIVSPASNAGTWFNGTIQRYDIDGDERLMGSDFVDIGADEFEGFQYTNDLGVQVILQPSGVSNVSGVITVTDENPFNVQAIVKNYGGIIAQDRNVYARIDYSTNNGISWLTLWMATPQNIDFAVNESRIVDFTGATITNTNWLYRVTVWVDNDQNLANNSLSKMFMALVKREAVLVSYESSSARGIENKDSVVRALNRLGVRYDILDRTAFGPNDIDYTPWWTLVWVTGNPAVPYNGSAGLGAVSLKEQEEIIRFLRAGETWAKKSLIMAGSNITEYNDPASPYAQLNNPVTDLEFVRDWLHTRYVARHPGLNDPVGSPTMYRGLLKGDGVYFVFNDSILSTSPDVVRRDPITGSVGEEVSRQAYYYQLHSATPMDSTAGVAWTQPDFNVVFYAFDWADPITTVGFGDAQGALASGTTRFMRGALDFVQSFRGTVLPVEFVTIKGSATKRGNEISWSVAHQTDLDRYEIELYDGSNWNTVGEVKASKAEQYSFTDSRTAAFETRSFTYRVASVDLDGSRQASKSVTVGRSGSGLELVLEQNFPNPFSDATKIGFTLPEGGVVSIRILDMTGKVIRTELAEASLSAGKQEIGFTAEGLASGTYIYELTFTNAAGETTRLVKSMKIAK